VTGAAKIPADLAPALAWRDLDLAAAVDALRSLALTTVAAVAGEAPAERDLAALFPARPLPRSVPEMPPPAVNPREAGDGATASAFWSAGLLSVLPDVRARLRRFRRIDDGVIDVLWPIAVAPALSDRRRSRARALLLQPFDRVWPEAHRSLSDLAVAAAAATMPPPLLDRLGAAFQPEGGLVAGAAILDWAVALAFRHPVFVQAIDGILYRRLRREVVLPRPADPRMNPMRLSDRALIALIAMVRISRLTLAAPTRRSMFERAWNERAVALWPAGDTPRDFDAWLMTAALRARGWWMDRRLAATARSAGLLGCPRFPPRAKSRSGKVSGKADPRKITSGKAAPGTVTPDRDMAAPDEAAGPAAAEKAVETPTVDYTAMPETLARFLRCEF
jgi:hypothetical protein